MYNGTGLRTANVIYDEVPSSPTPLADINFTSASADSLEEVLVEIESRWVLVQSNLSLCTTLQQDFSQNECALQAC